MESDLAKYQANPASTLEEGDDLLRLLLHMHPANDVRWKAIQTAWKRCSSIERSAQWLKNRAKKLEAEDAKRSKEIANAGYANQAVPAVRPETSGKAESDEDRSLKDLILMALDHQLQHGGSGASGDGLMGAMAQAFGDSFDDHAFHTACEFGRLPNIEQLSKSGCIDVNFRYKDGSTPLLIAMNNKHLEVCKVLVAMDGVDLNSRWVSRGCDTPLIFAVVAGQVELVEALLSKPADVNIQNSVGASALQKAAAIGNARLTQLLLEAAASVNLLDARGATAMKVALDSRHEDVVKLLMDAKASTSEADQNAPATLTGGGDVAAIRQVLESSLAHHRIAAAHTCAAEWATQGDGRSDTAWHLQQLCYQKSPFVWQHHAGLIVEKCEYGLCVRTRLPIRAHELVLAECAAVPWTLKETRDPEWVRSFLSGRVRGLHTLSEDEAVPFASLLEGLWPRNEADFKEALATFPEALQEIVASAGESAQEPMAIARSVCNSYHDGTHLSIAFFNHSCSPNCEIRGRYHVQLYATRDIEVGEELTNSYLRLSNLLQPAHVRKKIFQDTWASACACPRCLCAVDECQDDYFYAQLDSVQKQLHTAGAMDFLPLALKLCRRELFDKREMWKADLMDSILQEAVQSRLQQSEWQTIVTSSQRDDLLHIVEGLLQAFLTQKSIVGESKLLKPLCQTILQLECLYRKSGGVLPHGVTTSLQQVSKLELAFRS